MFAAKGLFSEIQCPYSDQCVLPNCLFSHAATKPAHPTPLAADEPFTTNSKSTKVSDEPLRKRRKLEQPLGATRASGSSTPVPKISPARRDISPPPLSRIATTTKKTPLKAASQTASSTPKSRPATPAKVVKAEALNPRMIKSSPAPHDLRFRLVKALHGHFVRLNDELRKDGTKEGQSYAPSDQELITMVLDMEELIARGKPTIYSNVIKNKILMYKRMTVQGWKDERRAERQEAEPDVPEAAPIEPPTLIECGLTAEEELAFLPRLYTSFDGLEKHGYVTLVPTEAEVEKARQGVEAAKGWEVCDRCKARFQVFPGRREEDGALTSGGKCIHHWGKPYWPERSAGDPRAKRERKYRCCEELIGDSPGCTQSDTHVFKITEVKRLATILNFAETPENDQALGKPICIDGEMGYTVHGLELIRLTATAWPGGDELLDILVRPIGEVLDLNSRWSGVWPQQMTDALPWSSSKDSVPSLRPTTKASSLHIVSSPTEARSLLCSLISPRTPLIGHGLENDLNAVRLVHPTIIDTALLFPHKAGLPYRNGLKALMFQHLGRHIQVINEGAVEGHDSKEDARAAGELVKWRLAGRWERMRMEGWTVKDGTFVAPDGGTGEGLSVEFLEGAEREEGGLGRGAGSKRISEEISGGP